MSHPILPIFQNLIRLLPLQGDVIFLLLESHLQDMGMYKIGDRLYFMEELTQLHDATNNWSKMLNVQLTSSRSLPNLRRNGLPLQVVSWSVREVSRWVEALGLKEWAQIFTAHRIQGDVMFSLKEDALKEMGINRIGGTYITHTPRTPPSTRTP